MEYRPDQPNRHEHEASSGGAASSLHDRSSFKKRQEHYLRFHIEPSTDFPLSNLRSNKQDSLPTQDTSGQETDPRYKFNKRLRYYLPFSGPLYPERQLSPLPTQGTSRQEAGRTPSLEQGSPSQEATSFDHDLSSFDQHGQHDSPFTTYPIPTQIEQSASTEVPKFVPTNEPDISLITISKESFAKLPNGIITITSQELYSTAWSSDINKENRDKAVKLLREARDKKNTDRGYEAYQEVIELANDDKSIRLAIKSIYQKYNEQSASTEVPKLVPTEGTQPSQAPRQESGGEVSSQKSGANQLVRQKSHDGISSANLPRNIEMIPEQSDTIRIGTWQTTKQELEKGLGDFVTIFGQVHTGQMTKDTLDLRIKLLTSSGGRTSDKFIKLVQQFTDQDKHVVETLKTLVNSAVSTGRLPDLEDSQKMYAFTDNQKQLVTSWMIPFVTQGMQRQERRRIMLIFNNQSSMQRSYLEQHRQDKRQDPN